MGPNLDQCDVAQRIGTGGKHGAFFLGPDAVYRGRRSNQGSSESPV
jgi:hypothetical protein